MAMKEGGISVVGIFRGSWNKKGLYHTRIQALSSVESRKAGCP